MEKLQAGIVGAGILGTAHATNLRAHEAVDVVAISDVRRDAAEQVAGSVGAQAYDDTNEMLRRHTLDVVVIATPDPLHREPALAVIEADVPNLIMEKPLATTPEDAHAIWVAAEEHDTRVFVNYANRTAPLDIATCHVIREGLLGDIVYGDVRLDDNISVPTNLWGNRSSDWAAGSSTAHFLLSHVVDLLRWYLHPAEITEVLATKQERVLGNTPDLYDAQIFFDNGAQVRAKAEWIKHMDELVEFYLSFSGSEGALIYNKLPGFGTSASWRANLSERVDLNSLLARQKTLREMGANLRAVVNRGAPKLPEGLELGDELPLGLEAYSHDRGKGMALVDYCIDAILEDTDKPDTWKGPGPLPTHQDGLVQTLVVSAIVKSAEQRRFVSISEIS